MAMNRMTGNSEVKTGEFKVGAGVRARDDGENGARRPLLWPG
jgi:hypothetical protein